MKQMFDGRRVLKLVGTLDKDDEGRYIVTVEEKDVIRQIDLVEILEEMLGKEISLTSEEPLR